MRRSALLATSAGLITSGLASGCGQQAATHPHSPLGRPTQVACITPQAGTVNVGDADNGKTFCLATGTGVFVFLHSTPADLWRALRPSSAALQRRPSGEMSLARGVTGAYFAATRTGVVTITSTRKPCHAETGFTCTPQTHFRVTLIISSPG